MMKRQYVLLSNNQIGYIDYLCKCEKCKERGEYELFINDFNDQYLDCIKLSKVCNEIKIASFNLEVILKYQLKHNTFIRRNDDDTSLYNEVCREQ